MKDSWCAPTRAKNGTRVSGGAARNVRIAAAGGMDTIVDEVARDAARNALARANAAVERSDNKTQPKYPSPIIRRNRPGHQPPTLQ